MPESIDSLRAEVRALQRKIENLARNDDDADWFTITEAAKRWRVSVSTVRRFEDEGRIEFRKFSTPNGKNYIAGDVVRAGPPHRRADIADGMRPGPPSKKKKQKQA